MSEASDELCWVGDGALRLALDAHPDPGARVRAALARLEAARLPGLVDLVPTAARLLLTFDVGALDDDVARALEDRVRAALADLPAQAPDVAPGPRAVREVPVCRCPGCAPDLEAVARATGLAPDAVARLHGEPIYTVEFLGFAPGFPYLAGLPAALHLPRRDVPRPRVPAGSVAIAGAQAGIYPRATPGGWHVVGRTDLVLFDPRRTPPAWFAPGDRVRFVARPHGSLRWDEPRAEAR